MDMSNEAAASLCLRSLAATVLAIDEVERFFSYAPRAIPARVDSPASRLDGFIRANPSATAHVVAKVTGATRYMALKRMRALGVTTGKPGPRGPTGPRYERTRAILDRIAVGDAYSDIARDFGCSPQNVSEMAIRHAGIKRGPDRKGGR